MNKKHEFITERSDPTMILARQLFITDVRIVGIFDKLREESGSVHRTVDLHKVWNVEHDIAAECYYRARRMTWTLDKSDELL